MRVAGLAACAIAGGVIAGCGAATTGAHGAATTPYGPANVPASLSRCMRANGLSSFPDPSAGPGGVGFPGGVVSPIGGASLTVNGITFAGPAYLRARRACARFLPPGGGGPAVSAARKRALLAEAVCMRAHGVPDFPDFRFSAHGGLLMSLPASIDTSAPAFVHAAGVCGLQVRVSR